jgi:hypothetical protein
LKRFYKNPEKKKNFPEKILMEKFNYDEYVSNRNDILESFDKFCDDLEDRALSNFGKDDGRIIEKIKRFRGEGEGIRETDNNVQTPEGE